MSSPLGVDQELLLSYSQNDTKNFNATIGIGGSEGYEFTVISIATSVLLGVMTLTTIIGRNIIIIKVQIFWEGLKNWAFLPRWDKFFWPSQNIWTLPFFMCRQQEQHCTTGFAFLIMFVVSKYLGTRYRSRFFGKLDMKPQMEISIFYYIMSLSDSHLLKLWTEPTKIGTFLDNKLL